MKKTLVLAFIVSIFGSQPALAYIDPGSGSAIMSVIIGAFVAIFMMVKTFWYRIKSLLGLSKSTKPSAPSDSGKSDSKNK
jgi:hypothetical protein